LRHDSRGDCPEIGAFAPSLSRTLNNLQGYLAREEVDQDTMMSSIHAVLYEVFITEQRSLASERQLPLVQYLIFCMLDYEGNFKALHEVRHFTAILTYWCRLVVFVEISNQDQAEQR